MTYGWYHLDTELGASSLGQACLNDLAEPIDAPPVPNPASLAHALRSS
nr:hypothetical protein [Herbidospora sakaeratensis]